VCADSAVDAAADHTDTQADGDADGLDSPENADNSEKLNRAADYMEGELQNATMKWMHQ